MPTDIDNLLGSNASAFERKTLESILGKQSAHASALSKAIEAVFEEFSGSLGKSLTQQLERIALEQVRALEGELLKLMTNTEHNIGGMFERVFQQTIGIKTSPNTGGFIPSVGQKAAELTELLDAGSRNL
ncbi:MAG: hypothetical protein K0R63_937 [Rickettsiales bacterium]|jgi:hypothetical protein|nr:hypothetical protein [Rickettsiales bacterium]